MIPKVIYAVVFASLSFQGVSNNANRYLKCVRSSDVSGLSEDFNNSLQLSTPGKDGFYSKSQAKSIISYFFDNHTPKRVKIADKGQSPNGGRFVELRTCTNRGEFDISIFYRVSESESQIHEIKIQK